MKKNQARTVELIAAALILLWVYTAAHKLLIYPEFKRQLAAQPFSKDFIPFAAVLLPLSELLTATLLCIKTYRGIGLWCSAILMVIFTAYVGLVLAGFFPEVPCSCGGVLKSLGWKAHFYFNIFWLLLTGYGLFLHHYPKRQPG